MKLIATGVIIVPRQGTIVLLSNETDSDIVNDKSDGYQTKLIADTVNGKSGDYQTKLIADTVNGKSGGYQTKLIADIVNGKSDGYQTELIADIVNAVIRLLISCIPWNWFIQTVMSLLLFILLL